MDPNATTIAILVICLVLVIAVYFLGFSTGRTLCARVARGSFASRAGPP